ncbi:hypothetical protein Naga_100947g1 [Nannochloropsis gaditana]|uniref:Uncharacterized protein n=1 Tax=Nannochloropsis gaditana TaxID=72520 RepID=W7SZA7_9STRA|nr:hypothetical protein Naga_100947g1 [Nannochloropsis gaditana]
MFAHFFPSVRGLHGISIKCSVLKWQPDHNPSFQIDRVVWLVPDNLHRIVSMLLELWHDHKPFSMHQRHSLFSYQEYPTLSYKMSQC